MSITCHFGLLAASEFSTRARVRNKNIPIRIPREFRAKNRGLKLGPDVLGLIWRVLCAKDNPHRTDKKKARLCRGLIVFVLPFSSLVVGSIFTVFLCVALW